MLCEDTQHAAFARYFLELQGIHRREIRAKICPPGSQAASQWVVDTYSKELAEFRRRSNYQQLVLCHAYKLGLTESQEVVGAKRGGKCIGIYIDDERQSSRPPGPRPAGLAANAPSAASPRFKGSTDPVFTAASCIWSVCRQSTLICRRDRALVPHSI